MPMIQSTSANLWMINIKVKVSWHGQMALVMKVAGKMDWESVKELKFFLTVVNTLVLLLMIKDKVKVSWHMQMAIDMKVAGKADLEAEKGTLTYAAGGKYVGAFVDDKR